MHKTHMSSSTAKTPNGSAMIIRETFLLRYLTLQQSIVKRFYKKPNKLRTTSMQKFGELLCKKSTGTEVKLDCMSYIISLCFRFV